MMNDELQHVGVLGMKWGHHSAGKIGNASVISDRKKLGVKSLNKITGNKKESIGSPKKVVSNSISKLTTKNMRGPNSTDHANVQAIKGKKMSTLSNSQLKMFNERVQLEKTYKQLMADRGPTKKGTKFVKDLFINAAKQNAQTYIAKGMGKGIENLIAKAAR